MQTKTHTHKAHTRLSLSLSLTHTHTHTHTHTKNIYTFSQSSYQIFETQQIETNQIQHFCRNIPMSYLRLIVPAAEQPLRPPTPRGFLSPALIPIDPVRNRARISRSIIAASYYGE